MRKQSIHTVFQVVAAVLLGVFTAFQNVTPAQALVVTIDRASVSSAGVEGNGLSSLSNISNDARYVVFESDASNLVSGDTNGVTDIFMRDRNLNTTTRISVSTAGVEGNGNSSRSDISADGRYVAFESNASNLVSGDTNGLRDIFIRDTLLGVTSRVSVATGGGQATGGNSSQPRVSANGQYVAFASNATNLVSGDTNGFQDIFVHDRLAGVTTRVSIASDGTELSGTSLGANISADGRYVAFTSFASNAVSGDTNGYQDIFVHDRTTGQTTRMSVSSTAAQANGASFIPRISGDGRYVTFSSFASNLVSGDTNAVADAFIHDRYTATTTRVSVSDGGIQGNNDSYATSISTDGRYVAFESSATNLVSADTNGFLDVFVRDLTAGRTTRVSVNAGGSEGNNLSAAAVLTGTGQYVTYYSLATNFVTGDTNNAYDIFVAEVAFTPYSRVGVYRPSNSTFYLKPVNTASASTTNVTFSGVSASAKPVVGDWDGDGDDTVGVFDNGTFYLKNENSTAAPIAHTISFGAATDIPVAGDWDGDGDDTIGLYRPSLGVFYLSNSLSATINVTIQFGDGVYLSTPLTGDWNRDGQDTAGTYYVWNDYNLTFLTNTTTNGSIGNPDLTIAYGAEGDVVFMGDWNGDGVDTPGVLRPSDGTMYLKNTNANGIADFWFTFGVPGDIPVAGNWGLAVPDLPMPSQGAPIFSPRQ